MEAQAPYGSLSLRPYAEALEAVGFLVNERLLLTRQEVDAQWRPVSGEDYRCTVIPRGPGVEVRLSWEPQAHFAISVLWFQLDTPQELAWLLERSGWLRQARSSSAVPQAA